MDDRRYTVQELRDSFSRAYNYLDFDSFVRHVLEDEPNTQDTWQLEKWEIFKRALHFLRIPVEYLEHILAYGANVPWRDYDTNVPPENSD